MSQPLLDASAHDLPRFARAGIALEVSEATFELGLLGGAERKLAGLGGDAIPEVLGELDALGDGQLADVEVSGLHMLSLPRASGVRNTLRVYHERPAHNLCAERLQSTSLPGTSGASG